MPPVSFAKYVFRIRASTGALVENLVIAGRNEADAVRKLQQMYRHCEIIECLVQKEEMRTAATTFEDVAGLISGSTG